MIFADKCYTYNLTERKQTRIKKRIRRHKAVRNLYVIVLPLLQDGLIERDSLTTFGEIIRGKKPGRESDDEIILVSIEGMPTEDVAWAYECYTYALVHDIGTKLKVWDRPYAF